MSQNYILGDVFAVLGKFSHKISLNVETNVF